jgi:TetR/AcrR family transcriptional regulator, ethionamide resistance regulator
MSSARPNRNGEVVDRLLNAAETLIAGGATFEELSVEQVISHAGVSRTSFYKYFRDKRDLLARLMDRVETQLATMADAWWNLPHDATRSDLRDAWTSILRNFNEHAPLVAAIEQTAPFDDGVRSRLDAMTELATRETNRHIRRAQEVGAANADIDADQVAPWLALIGGAGMRRLATRTDVDFDQLAEGIAYILWATVYSDASSRRSD